VRREGGGGGRKVPSPATEEIKLWSADQQVAYSLILEMAEVFFQTDWSGGGLRPRLDPLIVGPTGMGKSHLVRAVAQKLNLPVLRLTFNEWVVSGARSIPHTLRRLHAFIEDSARGIVHVDELDKFKSIHVSDWSTSVLGELLLLLDRSIQQPDGRSEWTPDLQEKLRRSILIIGSGTWQGVWTASAKPKMGFQTESRSLPGTVPQDIAKSGVIPDEIFRRFNSELVVLSPATEVDYRRGAEIFGLERMAGELGLHLDYAEAVERGLGARWLEEVLARLLRVARKQGKQLLPPAPPAANEPPNVTVKDLMDADDDLPF
jgi:SpoVK/Ycf46/Vps4 family AAA+-type ATPase